MESIIQYMYYRIYNRAKYFYRERPQSGINVNIWCLLLIWCSKW